jgi:DNA-binding LacI/PurR family transcriptional regulator
MVEYLCRTGAPPVFFEVKTPINPNALKRRAAYIAAMERLSQTPHLIQVDGEGWDFESIGFQGGKRVLSERQLPTNTVLCSNDRLAIGFLSAAFESGLRVGLGAGSAIRIAGHDDHPFSRFTCPSLTTVTQDYEAIAKSSVRTLLRLIESGDRSEERVVKLFEGRLIMRGSA